MSIINHGEVLDFSYVQRFTFFTIVTQMPDVILLGDINIDISATIAAYPTRGGEGIANTIEYYTGGAVFNTSVVLSRMGASAGILGRIGNDALAVQAITDIDHAGVDRSHLQVDNVVSTGLIYIVVNPDGERTMFSSRGANVFTQPQQEWENYFSNARWYHFSGYALLSQPQHDAAIAALDWARQNKCGISLDPNPEPAMRFGPQIKALLPKIDIFFPNEQELRIMTDGKSLKEGIDELLEAGAKAVVVKLGKKGCIVAYDKNYLEIPAFDIKVRNTTGAGDSFNAGMIMGRMVGLSWGASAVLGNALGGIASSVDDIGTGAVNVGRVVELIEQDQYKPQWEKWYWALNEVLAYLTAV